MKVSKFELPSGSAAGLCGSQEPRAHQAEAAGCRESCHTEGADRAAGNSTIPINDVWLPLEAQPSPSPTSLSSKCLMCARKYPCIVYCVLCMCTLGEYLHHQGPRRAKGKLHERK